MTSLALLVLRLTFGSLMVGHGAQKLFGWFGGHGPEGTGQFLESMGMRPGRLWAQVAGWSEFGGGLLTVLGLLHPLGPMTLLGPMVTAAATVHKDKPIWGTEGGAEAPVTNAAIAGALVLAGPGIFSFDRLLGTRLPVRLMVLAAAGMVFGLSNALKVPPQQMVESVQESAAEMRRSVEEVLSPAA